MSALARWVAAGVVILSLVLGPPSRAQQPVAPARGTEVGTCLSQRRHLLVLALIDESGSLGQNDPEAARVDGLRAALRTLAASAGDPGDAGGVRIDVLLAAFGTGFSPIGGWSPLTPQTVGAIEDRAAGFAERATAVDTDFASALLGAQRAFEEGEASSGEFGPPCRVLLVFTDGRYDIEPRPGAPRPYAPGVPLQDDEAVEAEGRRVLCGPGGVADQLRAAGTMIITIALSSEITSLESAGDPAFLRSLAEGEASGAACGDRREPAGAYIPVDGRDQLLYAFDAAVNQALGGTPLPGPIETPPCAPGGGAGCAREFALDASVRRFHALVSLGASTSEVHITPPGASEPLRVAAGQGGRVPLGGAVLDVTPASDRDLIIDGTLPLGVTDWQGTWTMAFANPTSSDAAAVTRSWITVFGGLTPTVEPAPTFRRGETATFEISVVDAEGSPRVLAGIVGASTVKATVTDPRGNTWAVPVSGAGSGGPFIAEYRVPDATDAGFLDLELTLEVVTRNGLRLQPRVSRSRIPVQPPRSYPILAPLTLRLPPLQDGEEAVETLTVTGSPDGGGCVWFGPADPTVTPPEAGMPSIRFEPAAAGPASCLRVEAGQVLRVDVIAQGQVTRSGLVEGLIPVHMVSDTDSEVRETTVPFSFDMRPRVDGARRGALFVTLLLAGVLLPLAALWLLSRAAARFRALDDVRRAQLPVTVTPEGIYAEEGRVPVQAGDITFGVLPVEARSADCRGFRADGLAFRARIPWLPFRLPYGTVRRAGLHTFASGEGTSQSGGARIGHVPFVLPNSWVFVAEEVQRDGNLNGMATEPAVKGTLYLYVSDDKVASKADRLWHKVERELPSAAAAAATLLRETEKDGGRSHRTGEPAQDQDTDEADDWDPLAGNY